MTCATNRWACKWLTGFCEIGTMLVIYKHQKHSICPRCLADNETVEHVLKCQDAQATILWNEELDNIKKWILDNKGCPEMAEPIVAGLQAWRCNVPFDTHGTFSPLLQTAITQQNRIGWKSFIEGFWANKWKQHQEAYLLSIKSQRSGSLWISKLQQRIWHIAWKLWDQRNNVLHSDGLTIHRYETDLIDQEITQEWG